MSSQFFCKNKDRWKKVAETPAINGIDYLEVSTSDQKTLTLFFLHDLTGSPASSLLSKQNVLIEGGVRVKDINVISAIPTGNVLTIKVDKPGDFSTYTLRIVRSELNPNVQPDGFDQQLSSIDFSFKINCPSEFDCKETCDWPPDNFDEPVISYLAKDYSSFSRLMFDRLSFMVPDWKERNAADLQVTLVELLAYVGDRLSYYQDAVATEAYMATARRRVSLMRHARLLDYRMHDGCNARAWVQIQTDTDNVLVKQPSVLMAANNYLLENVAISATEAQKLKNETDAVVFETMHDLVLYKSQNQISFYTWCDSNCCLPKGSTSATLLNQASVGTAVSSPPPSSPASYLHLKPGDVLIFEEIRSPETGSEPDADPSHRWAVRLKTVEPGIDELTGMSILNIEWYSEDALPFSLSLNSTDSEGVQMEISVARGNIVLVDHGDTQTNKHLQPETFDEDMVRYYPKIRDQNITNAVAFDNDTARSEAALNAIKQDVRSALASVSLIFENEKWGVQKDLLGSDRFATEFVVETEKDGTSFIRFGDNTLGKKPEIEFHPIATYRIGNGSDGNVGADAINKIVWDAGAITNVRNPMSAVGGTDPESMEEVRQYAPQAFRTQERAVTAADYVAKAKLYPEVQNAVAKFYWTGGWYTVYIIIDRVGGKDIDPKFKAGITNFLEQYRMAGYDIEIIQPAFISLDIALNVCVKQGHFQAEVKQGLYSAFSNNVFSDGTKGFFHPDHFTFGQPVYLSAIYKRAMSVAGVASVEIKTFQRWGKTPNGEIDAGLLQPLPLEILRLDNDPSLPENGRINFTMLNGL